MCAHIRQNNEHLTVLFVFFPLFDSHQEIKIRVNEYLYLQLREENYCDYLDMCSAWCSLFLSSLNKFNIYIERERERNTALAVHSASLMIRMLRTRLFRKKREC